MNTYCMIYELKEDCIEDYIKVHKNCPDYQIKALKKAGAVNLEIFMYNQYCIITYACSVSFDTFLDNLSKSQDNLKWQAIVGKMFKETPSLSGDNQIKSLDKIFSLRNN